MHVKLASTVRSLGLEVDDALEIAGQNGLTATAALARIYCGSRHALASEWVVQTSNVNHWVASPRRAPQRQCPAANAICPLVTSLLNGMLAGSQGP